MVRSFYGLRRGLAAGSAAAALLLHPVRAQQAPQPVRFIVRAWPDAAVFGATTTAEVLRRVLDDRLPRVTCAPCDPSRLWGVDRGAVGTFRAGPSNASDVLRGGATWGAGALLALSRGRGEGAARLEDILVFAEALTVTDAATTWTKVLFHRPRPERYAAGGPLPPDRDYSFPSGHTSQAFAAAAAYASILHRRGIAGRHRVEIAALFATAAATGAMRVAAHKHFPTDVLGGAVLGTAVGWSIPALHRIVAPGAR